MYILYIYFRFRENEGEYKSLITRKQKM